MLKWTASAQRVTQTQTPQQLLATMRTPRPSEPATATRTRKRRRATIAGNNNNKENIVPITSTPMVARARNSPLVLAPLSDILNVTPESPLLANTPERFRRVISTNISASTISVNSGSNTNTTLTNRRHSTVGFTLPMAPVTQYAATLPRFQEEEYSPSTAILPTGQQLALRGILPDPFLGNPRYFQSPELTQKQIAAKIEQFNAAANEKTLPKKRKLEQEFTAIAEGHSQAEIKRNVSVMHSAKMGDQTLDNLIDAILDSARKDEKKKKPRKSFNLRRRTLLKNQVENVQNELMLSPSYAAGDDPASDLSFLLAEPKSYSGKKALHSVTPKVALPPTPEPATPLPECTIPDAILRQMPTPKPALCIADATKRTNNVSTTTFMLETPVRSLAQKRRKKQLDGGGNSTHQKNTGSKAAISDPCNANVPKKFKVDTRNYFEIGLALPSIYV